MSREIDQRVVAMYFDNKDFQKKAQATIKTLDELKSNLNIEKSIKGFDTLKKVGDNLKLDEINTKVKRLKDSFQGLGGVVGKALDIGTAPLRSIENLFSTFQGYVSKVIGFDLAGKLVSGIEGAVRQLTIAPVSAGWSEYELKMDSIKTIMSGSGESLDVVTEKLQELNHYADQTVYSFSDMTSNIGKFTNNKVSLDDATSAMKGIANATADAGQGAQQASMAMYNISQAIGVGSMKMIDWKSLENANIATVKLKDSFIQAGVASGKLVKKVTKDAKSGEEVTKYYVKGFEKGKKAVEVTAENFRETLNKDWLDKDTMMKVFKIYSGELKSIEDVRKLGFTEALGFSDEDIQKFIDIGDNAMAAATEVRTFTKMFDALKEAAQSGWAETLELIFGNMEEATKLWTDLNNVISEVLEKSAEARNTIFGEWRGMYRDKEGNLKQTEDMYETVYEPLSDEEKNKVMGRIADVDEKIRESEEKIEMWNELLKDKKLPRDKRETYTHFIEATQATIDGYKSQRLELEKELLGHPVQKQIMKKQEDGRKVLIDSFFELIDILKDIGGAFSEAWSSVFGKFDSKTLWNITNGFRDFTKNLRAWLGTSDKAGSRLNKITTGLKGVFSVIKLAVNIFKSGLNLVSKIAQPIAEKAIDIFEKFGKVFEGLGDKNLGDAIRQIGSGISDLWNKITSLSWSDITNKFGEIWDKLKGTVVDWLNENGLGDVVTKLGEWKDSLKQTWDQVTKWFEESGIGQFFSDAWGWIATQFKPTTYTDVDENGNKVTVNGKSPVEQFLIDTWNAIKDAWAQITGWGGWQSISGFLTNTWGWIIKWFKPVTQRDDHAKGNTIYSSTAGSKSPVGQFLTDAWNSIKGVWAQVTAWSGWSAISSFLTNTWGWITSWFKPVVKRDDHAKGNTIYNTAEASKSPIAQFLTDAWDAIKGVWEQVTAWTGWNAISSFLTNTWGWITSWFKPVVKRDDHAKGNTIYSSTAGSKSPVGQFLTDAWDAIKGVWEKVTTWSGWSAISSFLTNTWDWITSWFKPAVRRDDHAKGNTIYSASAGSKSPVGQFLSDALESIKSVWTQVIEWEGWSAIGKFFTNTWDWIMGVIHGSPDATAGSNAATEIVTEAATDAVDASEQTEGAPEAVSILTTVLDALSGFWEKVSGFVTQVAGITGADRILKVVHKMFEIILRIVEVIVDIVHGAVVEGKWYDWVVMIGGLITAVTTNILSSRVRVALAKASGESEGVGEMVMKIALGLLIIAAAVALLGAQPQENLDKGASAMLKIAGIISGVAVVLGLINKFLISSPVQQNPVTGWERLGQNLIKIVGLVAVIKMVMTDLPELVKTMSGSGVSGEDIANVLNSITAMVSGIGLVLGVVTKLGGDNMMGMIKASVGILAGIAILFVGLTALFGIGGSLVNLIGGPDGAETLIGNIKIAGDIFSEVGAAIGQFIGGIGRGLNREQNKTAKENMEWLSEMTESFTPDKMIGMTRMMEAINMLTTAAPAPGSWNRVSKFNEELPKIGNALARFAVSFAQAFQDKELTKGLQIDPTTGLEQAIKQVEYVERLAKSMAEFQSFFKFNYSHKDILGIFDNTTLETVGIEDFSTLGTWYAQAAMAIVEAVKKGLDEGQIEELSTAFDATPIVDSIVIALGLGETAIAEAVHKMVQAGLDNSGNAGGKDGYDWNNLFGNGNGEGGETGGLMSVLTGGEGGFDTNSFFTNMFGNIDTDTLSTLISEKFGGFSGEMQSMFSIGDFQSQIDDFFPKNAEGELDVNTILGNWQENMEVINEQLQDSDSAIIIKPVFDVTDLEAGVQQINDYFRRNPITASLETGLPDMTINVDTSEIVSAIQDVKVGIQDLIRRLSDENSDNINAIQGLGGDIYEVARAIRAMRIYLDTGVLAGAIDEELGLQAILAGRTG